LRLTRSLTENRWSVPFCRLANAYNRAHHLKGVVHRTGEQLVSKPENAAKKKKKAVPEGDKESVFLKEDRLAPWRSKSALVGQSKAWPEFKALIAQAKARDRPVRGRCRVESDDEELPEPKPEPEATENPSTPKPKGNASEKKSTKRKRQGGAADTTPSSRRRKIAKGEKATDAKPDDAEEADENGETNEDVKQDEDDHLYGA
jgi:hypothetical protein